MALRYEHSKLRPTLVRLKDATVRSTDSVRSRNHGPGGRFRRGNTAAAQKGAKAIIKRHLGDEAGGEQVERLYRDSKVLFRSFLRDLPHAPPMVAELVARMARSAVLSAHYASQAVVLGLETDAGRKCMETSVKLDSRAERLAVTAWDLSQKLAQARPRQSPIARLAAECRGEESDQ